MPLTAVQIAKETMADKELHKIVTFLEQGKEISRKDRFHIEQNEFSLQQGVQMRGHRVVIPKQIRKTVLNELHVGHFGVVKMKGLARGICWWPNIDSAIEKLVNACTSCSLVKNNPPKAETHI